MYTDEYGAAPGFRDVESKGMVLVGPLEPQMDSEEAPASGVPEEKVGAVMVEVSDQKAHVSDAAVSRAHTFVSQPQLSFTHFMERPQLLGSFVWATTDAVGTVLYSKNAPHGLLDNTAAVARNAFKLFKCDFCVTVKVNATPFHAGRLTAYFVPLSTATEAETTHAGRLASETWVAHAFIDAHASSSATLRIPYRNIRPLLLSASDNFGALLITVGAQLSVGTNGSTSVPVSVLVSFPSAELRVIAPYAAP